MQYELYGPNNNVGIVTSGYGRDVAVSKTRTIFISKHCYPYDLCYFFKVLILFIFYRMSLTNDMIFVLGCH